MPTEDDARPPMAEERRPRPARGGEDAPRLAPILHRRRSWLIGLLLLAVFLGFAGVVWLAYQDGAGAAGDVPLIQAEARPFKVSPDDPGGLEVPNQRLAVNVLLGSEPAAEGSEPAEVVTVEPEVVRVPEPAPEPAPEEEEAAAASPAPPPLTSAGEQQATAEATPTPAPPPAAAPRPQPAPPAAAAPPPQPPAASTPERTAPPVAATASTPPPAAAASGARAFRIQLAAVRDEGRARQASNELWQSYSDVLGRLEPRVERAEIGDSVFFRIQAGPFESRDVADEICAALKARQAACIVVNG